MIAGYGVGGLKIKTNTGWTSINYVDVWKYAAQFDSKADAEAEAVRIAVSDGDNFDWIKVKKARRPIDFGLRWGIKDRRRGSWRFHADPTVRNGWSWHIFDALVKILTFATKAEAEGWLTMYQMATGERGRVVAAPLDIARREWGGERDRGKPSG